MHVLYLTDRVTVRGGAGLHLLDVMAAVEAVGHRVTVAAGKVDRTAPAGFRHRTVRLRGLASPTESSTRLDGLDELLERADVVHLQNVMNPEAIRRAVATRRAIATVQDHRVFCPGPGRTLPDGSRCTSAMGVATCAICLRELSYRQRMVQITSARRDAMHGARLVVLSRYMADELEAAGLPGATVIPPWVEPCPQAEHDGDAFLLGGRLVFHKAPKTAWEAWRSAGRPLPLRVAGTGPVADQLAGAELLGWLDRSSLRDELRRARALLFPTRWQEPFGILGVEALATGTPVIVMDRGGTRDWSTTGCLRAPENDTAAFADAIRRLAEDPERAAELGSDGAERIRETYAKTTLCAKLLELYESVRR